MSFFSIILHLRKFVTSVFSSFVRRIDEEVVVFRAVVEGFFAVVDGFFAVDVVFFLAVLLVDVVFLLELLVVVVFFLAVVVGFFAAALVISSSAMMIIFSLFSQYITGYAALWRSRHRYPDKILYRTVDPAEDVHGICGSLRSSVSWNGWKTVPDDPRCREN